MDVNQGTVDVNVDYLAGANNYNLIGNPYPCPINLRSVIMSNGSFLRDIYGTVYLYSPAAQSGALTTIRGGFTPISTLLPFPLIIPSIGAFYVLADANRTIRFQESAKTTTNSNYVLFGETKMPRLKLNITASSAFMDEVFIGFDKTSTANGNDFYDANKLANSILDFYTIAADKKH